MEKNHGKNIGLGKNYKKVTMPITMINYTKYQIII